MSVFHTMKHTHASPVKFIAVKIDQSVSAGGQLAVGAHVGLTETSVETDVLVMGHGVLLLLVELLFSGRCYCCCGAWRGCSRVRRVVSLWVVEG